MKNRLILNICFAYTSRNEIFNSFGKSKECTVEEVEKNLFIKEKPDIIVRTSGEVRLSDFLTWQSGKSLLYFCQTHWPDFNEWEFFKVLLEYQSYYKEIHNN